METHKLCYTVVLFGEAEKGKYRTAYYCQTLDQLDEYLGNPPPGSQGLYYAVQTVLFKRNLIFFRVPEEGYSRQDYLQGLDLLQQQKVVAAFDAICTPGVGDQEIIDAIIPVCHLYHSVFITNESDLYDYLTFTRAR